MCTHCYPSPSPPYPYPHPYPHPTCVSSEWTMRHESVFWSA
jgi:hypothetical protein